MRPKIFVVDGRQYRLNTADCLPPGDDVGTRVENAENLPSYVERDGKTLPVKYLREYVKLPRL